MKIGILTYHRTLNYGACLQAVATRVVLENMGHEVYYVDYWPEYHKATYAPFRWSKFWWHGLRGKWKYVFKYIKYHKFQEKRIANFKVFQDEFISPFCKPLTEEYDIIIYGSDQIWRRQTMLKDYNPIYFGENNLHTKKHIAFSASMGILPKTEEQILRIRKLLSHMDRIAVREEDLMQLLKKIGYTEVTLTIDPTLLLNKDAWDNLFQPETYIGPNYVLVYTLGRKKIFDFTKIEEFARRLGLMVKYLESDGTHDDTDTHICQVAPKGFIELIQNATYVFTSSFHGLAFSIIYEKNFYVSYASNSNRAATLLSFVGLKERMIAPEADIPYMTSIDYNDVNKKLNKLRQASNDYLSSI